MVGKQYFVQCFHRGFHPCLQFDFIFKNGSLLKLDVYGGLNSSRKWWENDTLMS